MGTDADSTIEQPTYIKVAIRTNRSPSNPISFVQHVDFYYYVNHSLPFEWAASSGTAAYEAGALSVKSFAWHWIINGGKDYPSDIRAVRADVDNTTWSQSYSDSECDPLASSTCLTSGSRSGVYQTQSKFLKNGTGTYLAYHVRGACDPNNDGVKDSNCYYDDRYQVADNSISQEGSRYLAAVQGWQRNAILTGYYTNPAVTIADITPPEVRSFQASGVTDNSITLSWLNYPGDTSSQIGKWNPTINQYSWTTVAGTSSYTYTGLSPNVYYDFTVRACNAKGCGRRSFDNGWITASTHWDDTAVRPPTYEVHFITDTEIRFALSKAGATSFRVYKKGSNGWQGPLPMFSFNEFRETNLVPSSTHEYAACAVVNGACTEFTNGGSFTVRTYPTR